jgi:hypothetical protein
VATALFVRPDRSGIGFTRKVPDGSLVMREWAVATRKAREIGFAAEGSELITCTPGNRLLTAWRSQVFFFEPETDRWLEFADLDNAKVTNITRLAVSPDGKWIALVSR